MVSPNFSLAQDLFIPPSQKSTPLQLNTSSIRPNAITSLDKLFYFLVDKKIIEDGVLLEKGTEIENTYFNASVKNLTLCNLKEPQLMRLDALLDKSFKVISKTFPLNSNDQEFFEFTITLREIFLALSSENIEIVGGSVFWILGEEFVREFITALEIPDELISSDLFEEFKKEAADIDIRIYCSQPEVLKRHLINLFKKKLPEDKQSFIGTHGFTKLYTHKPKDVPNPDHFEILSFGNRKDFSVDLLLINKLKRKKLFEHDALKIEISYLSKPFRTTNLRSNGSSILASLLLKLTKTLKACDVDEIDESGRRMIFTYFAKGWRCPSTETKETLLTKFYDSKNFKSLEKTLENHFPNDPFAKYIFSFYVCYYLPKNLKDELENILSSLTLEKPNQVKDSPLTIFSEIMREMDHHRAHAETVFNFIHSYLQIYGSILSSFKAKSFDAAITISHNSTLQWKFQSLRPLYLTLEDHLAKALLEFKTIDLDPSLKNSLISLFQRLNDFFIISENAEFNEAVNYSEETLKTAFSFFESEDLFLQKTGFYLLCSFLIQQKNCLYLPDLLLKLPNILKNEKSVLCRKNLFSALHKYSKVAHKEYDPYFSEFSKILREPEFDSESVLKDFCVAFDGIDICRVKQFIDESATNMNDRQLFCSLIKKRSLSSPRQALEMFADLLQRKDVSSEELKSLFGIIFCNYKKYLGQTIFERDFLTLSEICFKLATHLSPLKQVPKKEDINCFFEIAELLIKKDYAKGAELIDLLQQKRLIAKALPLIISRASSNDKASLSLQSVQTNPIDFSKAAPHVLQERLDLFIACISENLNEIYLKKIITAIADFFKSILDSKKPVPNRIKETFSEKLSWFSTHFLNQIQKDALNLGDLTLLYLKIVSLINKNFILEENTQKRLTGCFGKIEKGDSSSALVLFLHEFFQDFSKKQLKQVSESEFLFYKSLAELCVRLEEPMIAEVYLRKTLSWMHLKSTAVETDLISHVDLVLNQLIVEKKPEPATSFLSFFENLFPSNALLNRRELLKAIFSSFDEYESLKAINFVIKNKELFLYDNEFFRKIESVVVRELLSHKVSLKSVSSCLELIQTYRLSSNEIIEALANAITALNNKEIGMNAFTVMQALRPVTQVNSILRAMLTLNPLIYLNFAADLENTVKIIEAEKDPNVRRTHLMILTEGFVNLLKLKKLESHRADAAFVLLETKMICTGILEKADAVLFDWKLVQGYLECDTVTFSEQRNKNMWKKLEFLSSLKEEEIETQDLLLCFAKMIVISEKNDCLKNTIKAHMISVQKHLSQKVNASNLVPFLNLLAKTSSVVLLTLGFSFTGKALKKKPKGALLDRLKKALLDSLLPLSIQLNQSQIFSTLIKCSIFSGPERVKMFTNYSNTLFSDKETIKDKNKIVDALTTYMHVLTSPIEDLKFQQALLEKAIRHLVILGSLDFEMYISIYETIFENLIIYFKEDLESPMLQQDVNFKTICKKTNEFYFKDKVLPKANPNEMRLMKQKLFNVFECLTQTVCTEMKDQSLPNLKIDPSLFFENGDIVFLIMLFPREKEKLKLIYKLYLEMVPFVSPQKFKLFLKNISGFFVMLTEKKMFTDSKEDDKILFKTSVFHNGLQALKSMEEAKIRECLLEVIDELIKLNTLQSLVMAFYYITKNEFYFIDIAQLPNMFLNVTMPIMQYSTRCLQIQNCFKMKYPVGQRNVEEVLKLLGQKFFEEEELNYP